MQAKRLLLLIALVSGLGFLAWKVGENESQPEVFASRKLASQIESSRVSRIVVERPISANRFVIERDARGTWLLTEPVAWRAEPGFVNALLGHLSQLSAEVMTGLDESEVELEPGQMRLGFTERIGDRDKHWLVRVGRFDLDDSKVFCAVDEVDADGNRLASAGPTEILRVPRPIFDTPRLGYDPFRSRKLVDIEASQVVAIRRRGSLAPPDSRVGTSADGSAQEGGALDCTLEATGPRWAAIEPFRARLEPSFVAGFLLILTQLRVANFVDDDPEDPGLYGFDPPWFELEADLGDGNPMVLEFGSESALADREAGQRAWYVRRKGLPNVFTIRPGIIYTFAQPVEEMVDANLFQARREDVQGFELTSGEVGLRFDRLSKQRFSVRSVGEDEAAALPADKGQAEDLLARLESAATIALLPRDRTFESVGELKLFLGDGSSPVVEFAERIEHFGVEGIPVRRQGEQIWGLIVDGLDTVADGRPDSYLSRLAFDVAEFELHWIELEGLGRKRRWNRDGRSGIWQPQGVSAEDREFSLWVDRLRSPRVRAWRLDLEPGDVLGGPEASQDTESPVLSMGLSSDRRGFDPLLQIVPGTNEDGERVTFVVYEGRVGEASPELYDGLEELLLVVGR